MFFELKCFIYKVELMKVLSLVYFINESKSTRHAQCSVSSGASYAKYNVELMKVLSLVYFIDERKSLRHAQCSLSSTTTYGSSPRSSAQKRVPGGYTPTLIGKLLNVYMSDFIDSAFSVKSNLCIKFHKVCLFYQSKFLF
jgi:hypothetical protein